MLEKFQTLKTAMSASEEELAKVRGLGPVTIQKIKQLMDCRTEIRKQRHTPMRRKKHYWTFGKLQKR
jgi:DNA repair protein RadC